MEKYLIWNKKKEIVASLYDTFNISPEEFEIIENDELEYRSLHNIWNEIKRPFIAKNIDGWYVIIKKDPIIQEKKYDDRIYGYISTSLKGVIIKAWEDRIEKKKGQQIHMQSCEQWKFIDIF